MVRQELVQKQTQKIYLSQELRNSIELLPLSTLDLLTRINIELEENPVLEEKNNPGENKADLYSAEEMKKIEKHESIRSTENLWSDSGSGSQNQKSRSDTKQKMLESTPDFHSLQADLLDQLHMTELSGLELERAEILITMIDEHGFITQDKTKLAEDLKCSEIELNEIIKKIHQLDPLGIGASGIQESLLIQARSIYPNDSLVLEILSSCFQELTNTDYRKISKALKVSEESVGNAIRDIRKLEPFPSSCYREVKADYIYPDIIIESSDSEIKIQFNDEIVPEIYINTEINNIMKECKSQEEKDYFHQKINSANWLIRSLSQRKETLSRVMETIVMIQKDFFLKGPGHLYPLKMKEISEHLDIHESTISRVTSNKYVQTKWGIHEMKWFFTSGIMAENGTISSTKNIQEMILTIVKDEKPDNPLSDSEIAGKLNEKGVEAARRTIAKYRKILGILPKGQRKKMKEIVRK